MERRYRDLCTRNPEPCITHSLAHLDLNQHHRGADARYFQPQRKSAAMWSENLCLCACMCAGVRANAAAIGCIIVSLRWGLHSISLVDQRCFSHFTIARMPLLLEVTP